MPLDLEAGTVVAKRYRITRPLGRGGMGEVYGAENIRTGRQVAVKLLRNDAKDKSSAVARFRQEARAAGAINSDHVTQVLDIEEDAEFGVVIVFELLEGESLIDRLKRTGPIPMNELWAMIEEVWMGLADAHKVGVIHRDLKPSNVFLERRPDGITRVKILDFGISKLPKEMGGETLTEMGQSLGTFSFMPPEQIGRAKTVDHRADIYACGTLIYQSLTGQLPYVAKNILVLVEMKAKTNGRSLAEALGAPVDPPLEAFVAKTLARDPASRHQTAGEALTAWRGLRPPDAVPLGGPTSLAPRSRPREIAAPPMVYAPKPQPPAMAMAPGEHATMAGPAFAQAPSPPPRAPAALARTAPLDPAIQRALPPPARVARTSPTPPANPTSPAPGSATLPEPAQPYGRSNMASPLSPAFLGSEGGQPLPRIRPDSDDDEPDRALGPRGTQVVALPTGTGSKGGAKNGGPLGATRKNTSSAPPALAGPASPLLQRPSGALPQIFPEDRSSGGSEGETLLYRAGPGPQPPKAPAVNSATTTQTSPSATGTSPTLVLALIGLLAATGAIVFAYMHFMHG